MQKGNEMGDISVSNDPYKTGYYTPEANSKNTLTMTSYFQLLAAQLQNQDMTNPMDNSEMMAQLTQMAMVQSMTTMNDSIQTSSIISTSTYAAGLMGQDVTVAVLKEDSFGNKVVDHFKTAKVAAVDLSGSSPRFKIEGDENYYYLNQLVGMGEIKREEEKPDDGKGDGDGGVDGSGGAEGDSGVDGSGGADGSGGVDGSGGTDGSGGADNEDAAGDGKKE